MPVGRSEFYAGGRLRRRRQSLGLTLREVAVATAQLARSFDNDEYSISVGRLSEIENRGAVPNVFRLHSLALVYDINFTELLSWYGVHIEPAGQPAK